MEVYVNSFFVHFKFKSKNIKLLLNIFYSLQCQAVIAKSCKIEYKFSPKKNCKYIFHSNIMVMRRIYVLLLYYWAIE